MKCNSNNNSDSSITRKIVPEMHKTRLAKNPRLTWFFLGSINFRQIPCSVPFPLSLSLPFKHTYSVSDSVVLDFVPAVCRLLCSGDSISREASPSLSINLNGIRTNQTYDASIPSCCGKTCRQHNVQCNTGR